MAPVPPYHFLEETTGVAYGPPHMLGHVDKSGHRIVGIKNSID
jgi:hypothetical protein